jgi:hypothetical protein
MFSFKSVVEKEAAIERIAGVRIVDILLAPKMCETLVLEPGHRRRIDDLRIAIRDGDGKLPMPSNDSNKIILSVAEGRVQVHDGNHRLVALALENPAATINNIRNHIRYVHDKELYSPVSYHFHIHTNFIGGAGEGISSSDGRVKHISSRKPICFMDPEIFSREDVYDGKIYTSFGLSIKTAVDAINNENKIYLGEIGIERCHGDEYDKIVITAEINVGFGNAVFVSVTSLHAQTSEGQIIYRMENRDANTWQYLLSEEFRDNPVSFYFGHYDLGSSLTDIDGLISLTSHCDVVDTATYVLSTTLSNAPSSSTMC